LGTQEQYNDLIKDKDFVSQLNPTYKKNFGVDIKTPEDLVVAYGLATKQPKREDRTGYDFTKEWYFREGQKRQDIRSASNRATDPLTYLNQGLNVLGSKNEESANNYFSNWKRQAKFSLGGDQIGFKDIKFIPKTDDFKVNYTIDVNKVAVPQSQQFNLKDPQLLAKLISLHQNFLGSDVKLEKSQNTPPKLSPTSTGGKIVQGKKDSKL
jgi:hypothetical protein